MRLSQLLFVLCIIAYRALAQSSGGVDLSKEMPGILYGTVSNDSGEVAGERIAVFYIGADHGREVAIRACASTTDHDGTYRCDGLSPGDYLVLAINPPQKEPKLGNRQGMFSFYGNTGNLDKAALIHLRSRDYQAANFSLSSISNGYSIQGKIFTKNVKAEVTLYALSESGLECPLPVQVSGNESLFSFTGLPSGRYRIEAHWNEGTQELMASTEFEISDHDISAISLGAIEPVDIRLSLENSDSWGKAQLGNATSSGIALEEIDTGATVLAVPDRSDVGNYIFTKVKPGTYWLSMDERSIGCIDTISSGGREVSNPLPIPANVTELTVNGLVRSICGSVHGMLSPAMKAEIVLTTDKFATIRTATSDQNGNFTIRGLPSGEYRVYSWSSLKNIAFRNRSFLRSLQDHSSRISVSGGDSTAQVEVLKMDF